MEFKRMMSARERMRLWFPNINVVVTAKIKGSLDLSDLTVALETLRNIHPLMGVKVILDDTGKGIFSNKNVPPIPITQKALKTGDDLEKTIKDELKVRWDFQTGPLMRLTILSNGKEHYLIFCAHHAICDGRSFVYLIRDLLGCYADPTACQSAMMKVPASVETRLPAGVKTNFLAKIFIGAMNRKWLQKGFRFGHKDYREMHQSFWQDRITNVLLTTIEEEEYAPFIKKCRSEGCSVNSAIYVAFLLSQLQVQHVENENVLIPIDLRAYLQPPLKDVFGYYASALVIQNMPNSSDSFWGTAKNFEAIVKRRMKVKTIFSFINTALFNPGLLDGAIFALNGIIDDEQAVKLSHQIFKKLATNLMVSNLGKIDIPLQYRDLELVDIIPPVLTSGNTEKVIEISTFNRRMNFSITYDPEKVSAEVVENIFNRVRNTIIYLAN